MPETATIAKRKPSIYFVAFQQIEPVSGSLARAHSTINGLCRLGCRVEHGYYKPSENLTLLNDTQATYPDFTWAQVNLRRVLRHDVLWLTHFWSPSPLVHAVSLMDEVRRLKPDMPIIVDLTDVILADKASEPFAIKEVVAYLEGVLLHGANSVVLVSKQEKSRAVALYGLAPEKITVIPTSHDVRDVLTQRRFSQRLPHICMAGTTHPHNLRAFAYALTDIWPKIHQSASEPELHIFGKDTETIKFTALGIETPPPGKVKLIGSVDDFQDALSKYRVHLVPTVSGVGVKTKVLDSLATGTPIVGTTKCMEGLDLQPGNGVFVAEEPEEIATHCLRLLTDETFWNDASTAATEAAKRLSGHVKIEDQCQIALDIAFATANPATQHTEQSINHVFLYSPCGRSSSTALQRILNSSGQIRVYGESHGVVDNYLQLLRQVESLKHGVMRFRITPRLTEERTHLEQAFDTGRHDIWYPNGLPDWSVSNTLMLQSFSKLFPGAHETGRFGFKETTTKKLQSLLELTVRYPNAHVLIVFRNPVDQWQSINSFSENDWDYARDINSFTDEYSRLARIYLQFEQMRPRRTVFIEDTKLKQNKFIKALFRYLDLASHDEALISDGIGSSNPAPASDETRSIIESSPAWDAYKMLHKLSRDWRYFYIR